MSSLGYLAKLPLELRLVIYEEFMLWNRYSTPEDEWWRIDPLAILRSCKAVNEEVTALMYHGRTLVFLVDWAYAAKGEPEAGDPCVEILLRRSVHRQHSISFSRSTASAFRNAAYHRFQVIDLHLAPTRYNDLEKLFYSFQVMKLVVGCLTLRADTLPPIRVFADNTMAPGWGHAQGGVYPVPSHFFLPTSIQAGAGKSIIMLVEGCGRGAPSGVTDLYVLLGPLGILKKPITLYTARRIASSNGLDPCAENANIVDSDESFVVALDPSSVERKEEDDVPYYASILGDRIQLFRVQAVLEHLLFFARYENSDSDVLGKLWKCTNLSKERELILGAAAYKVEGMAQLLLQFLALRWVKVYPRDEISKLYVIISSKRIFESNEPLQPIKGPLEIRPMIDESPSEDQPEVISFRESVSELRPFRYIELHSKRRIPETKCSCNLSSTFVSFECHPQSVNRKNDRKQKN